MIQLSYSTINMLLTASHNWLNKMMGLKPEDKWYFKAGRDAHRIIQDHVAGINPDPRLAHITDQFPIVEEVDFDERCKFSKEVENYLMVCFFDGLNEELKKSLEIKTSSNGWSISQFQDSMQRKVYGFIRPDLKDGTLITCAMDSDKWLGKPPKVFYVPYTEHDRNDAKHWILSGIKVLEKGDFTGGLEDGKCTDPNCYYGVNCQFK